jgi:hypothetical protein
MRVLIFLFASWVALSAVYAPAQSQSDTGIVLRGSRIGESFDGYATQQQRDAAKSSGEYRSPEVARDFQREHPCPATGGPLAHVLAGGGVHQPG